MRLVKKQRGASMVELAVITPLLVIILFGFIEIGRALIQTSTLTKAVITGARYVAREPNAVTDTPHCTEDNTVPTGTWDATIAQATSIVAYSDPDGGSTTLTLPGLDASGAVDFSVRLQDVGGLFFVCVVRVTAQTQFLAIFGDSIVPFLNLGPILLNAVAEERYIGE